MDKHTPKERRNERIEEVILEVRVQLLLIICIGNHGFELNLELIFTSEFFKKLKLHKLLRSDCAISHEGISHGGSAGRSLLNYFFSFEKMFKVSAQNFGLENFLLFFSQS